MGSVLTVWGLSWRVTPSVFQAGKSLDRKPTLFLFFFLRKPTLKRRQCQGFASLSMPETTHNNFRASQRWAQRWNPKATAPKAVPPESILRCHIEPFSYLCPPTLIPQSTSILPGFEAHQPRTQGKVKEVEQSQAFPSRKSSLSQ